MLFKNIRLSNRLCVRFYGYVTNTASKKIFSQDSKNKINSIFN